MQHLNQLEIPGKLSRIAGKGGLPALRIVSAHSSAEIYLHGAHVTDFQKHGDEPLLFMSRASTFEPDKPIRGGIPVIFPWFGPREGQPMHGFARTTAWNLTQATEEDNGAISCVFALPEADGFLVQYTARIGERLALELCVKNTCPDQDKTFETCLHTYFHTGPVEDLSIHGLEQNSYFDKLIQQEVLPTHEPIRISEETDRIYLAAEGAVEIVDSNLNRIIRIHKQHSNSTVVWNPWIAKSKAMPDFGDEEYNHMLCVESGNVGGGAITLKPGEQALLAVGYETAKLNS